MPGRSSRSLDRAELLELVDGYALCHALNVPVETEGYRRYKAWCPFHGDTGRPNLSLGPEPCFHCFSCGAEGSYIDLVAYLNRETPACTPKPAPFEVAAAFAWLNAFVQNTPTPPTAIPIAPNAPPVDPDPIPDVVRFKQIDDLHNTDAGKAMLAYLEEVRGISREVIRAHALGFEIDTGRLAIPVYDNDGDCRNIRRYLPNAPKGEPKVKSYARGYGRNRRLNPDSGRADFVLVCAGEMDYLVARTLGFDGADAFTTGERSLPDQELVSDWAGRNVYILYDHDDAGRTGAQRLAERLYGYGCIPRILEWHPDSAPGFDLSDYTNNCRSLGDDTERIKAKLDKWLSVLPAWGLAEFDRKAEQTPAPEPAPQPEPAPDGDRIRIVDRSDVGNATRLIALHGKDLRYVERWQTWVAWSGERWVRDETGEATRRAVDTARHILERAFREPDDDERKRWMKWAADSHGAGRISSMLKLAQSVEGVGVVPDLFDSHPWLLGVPNGTLDLESGTLHPPTRESMLTKQTAAAWIPGAASERWDTFLSTIFPDPELKGFVQRAAGASLVGEARDRVLFICWGAGRNGKTTLLEVLRRVAGDYGVNSSSEVLMKQRPGAVRTDIARLVGARFVTASETNEGRKMDVGVVKELTGDGAVTARNLYEKEFDYVPQFKLWLQTNHKPVVPAAEQAAWDRIRLIPFTVRIPDAAVDPQLKDKLLEDREAVLAWMIEGAFAWRDRGLGSAQAVEAAGIEYRLEMDPLLAFFEDACLLGADESVRKSRLYELYEDWAEGANETVLSRRAFAKSLRENRTAGVREGFNARGQEVWRGVGERHHQTGQAPTDRSGQEPRSGAEALSVSGVSDEAAN